MKSQKTTKTNIVLGISAGISLVIIIAVAICETYYAECDLYVHCKAFIDVIDNLALSLVMSYVFYLIAYIPDHRRQKSINNYSDFYIKKIKLAISNMNTVLESIVANNITDICASSPKIKSKYNKSTGTRSFFTYEDHFLEFYKEINEYYEKITPYTVFLDDTVRDSLFELIHSECFINIFVLVVENETSHSKNLYLQSISIQDFSGLLSRVYNTI